MGEDVARLPELESFVAAKHAAKQLPRAMGHLQDVGEPALRVGLEADPDRAGSPVEPAANCSPEARKLSCEAKHRLPRGIELVGRNNDDADSRPKRPTGEDDTEHGKQGEDYAHGADQRQRGLDDGEHLIDSQTRERPPNDGRQHPGGDDQKQRRVLPIAGTHVPISRSHRDVGDATRFRTYRGAVRVAKEDVLVARILGRRLEERTSGLAQFCSGPIGWPKP
jgi:hypothetical protein